MTFWRQLAPEQHRFELGRSTYTQIFLNTAVPHNPKFAEPKDVEEGTMGTEQPHMQRADSKLMQIFHCAGGQRPFPPCGSRISCTLFFFLLYHVVCGVLVPWPRIEPGPKAVKAES